MGIKVSSNRKLSSAFAPNVQVTRTATAQAVRTGRAKPRAIREPSGSFVVDALNRHSASKPECIIIHTTGSGLAARLKDPKFKAWRQKHPEAAASTFEAGVWVYCNAMDFSPHVLIGQGGELCRLIADDLIAEHVGTAKSQAYARQSPLASNVYRWWRDRFPGLKTPAELVGGRLWRAGSCNALSLGVEVACPADDPTGPWSEAAWVRLARQVVEWSTTYGIPIDRNFVLTHSDAHPYARTSKGEPYDPGPRQWPGFETLARYVQQVVKEG